MFTFPENREQVRPTVDTGKGLTRQASKDETDINLILKKYQRTGILSFVSRNQPGYMDVENITYHEAMNLLIDSNEMFAEMPSSLRKRFNNSPGDFLEFVHNSDNLEEMYDLGLAIRPPPVPEPVSEPVIEP